MRKLVACRVTSFDACQASKDFLTGGRHAIGCEFFLFGGGEIIRILGEPGKLYNLGERIVNAREDGKDVEALADKWLVKLGDALDGERDPEDDGNWAKCIDLIPYILAWPHANWLHGNAQGIDWALDERDLDKLKLFLEFRLRIVAEHYDRGFYLEGGDRWIDLELIEQVKNAGNWQIEIITNEQNERLEIMGIKIKQTVFETLEDGVYKATVEDIVMDEDGKYGPQLRWVFKLSDREQTLVGWCSATFSPRSKLYKWSSAIRPNIPTDYDFDSDDFVGKPVQLVVTVETKADGTDYNKIVNVRPANAPADVDDEIDELEAALDAA